MTRSVLIVAAHPDDEALGCGGTAARLAGEGADVHVLFLADGVSARAPSKGQAADAGLSQRRDAAMRACGILGTKPPRFQDFPDNRLDTVALLEVIQPIEAKLQECTPDTVFTHHAGDLNIDHRRIHEAVVTACRPQRGSSVRSLLFFEVPSSTEWQPPGSAAAFVPNAFFDISNTLQRKLAALDAYAAEMRPWPHPRSRQAVEHLARWRGATVGMEAAEAFVIGRQLS
jgi:LmbE family N-acetylglucosaminyl deacetylase